jgi:phospholipase/lecithinase/hemolysin
MIYEILVRLKRAFVPSLAIVMVTLSGAPCIQAEQGGLPGKPDSNSAFSAIYVIGDSLSDTGRTSAVLTTDQVSFPPFPYAAGRMSNGPLWIEYLAPKLRQAYNPLDNLSWAGAMTGFTRLTPPPPVYNNVYGPLPGMTNELVELQNLTNSALDPKALYVVFGGTNDFLQIQLPAGANAATVIETGVRNLFTIVNVLYVSGARKIVVVNVPDLGRIPLNLSRGPAIVGLATQFSAAFNSALDTALNSLSFPTCRVSLFDLSREFADKPKKYGFTNVTQASFPDLAKADTYLFWDEVHPTTRAHQHLADEVFLALAKAGMLKHQPK